MGKKPRRHNLMSAQIVTSLIGNRDPIKVELHLTINKQMSKFSYHLHQLEDKNFGISFVF